MIIMKRAALFLVTLVAACGQGGRDAATPRESGSDVQTAELTGLYETPGEGGQPAQMCMVSDSSGTTRFGIVTGASGGGSCGGAGTALRDGDRLTLTMTGDEQCVIEARLEGTSVTFPSTLGQGCAYYCGPGASLAGARFEKTGGSADDAMRALDLAGDPLCS